MSILYILTRSFCKLHRFRVIRMFFNNKTAEFLPVGSMKHIDSKISLCIVAYSHSGQKARPFQSTKQFLYNNETP
jgi:hypothetical protein